MRPSDGSRWHPRATCVQTREQSHRSCPVQRRPPLRCARRGRTCEVVRDRQLVGGRPSAARHPVGDLQRAQDLALCAEPADTYAGPMDLGGRFSRRGSAMPGCAADRRHGLASKRSSPYGSSSRKAHPTDQHLGDRRAAGRPTSCGRWGWKRRDSRRAWVGVSMGRRELRQHPELVAVDADHIGADKGECLYGREVRGALARITSPGSTSVGRRGRGPPANRWSPGPGSVRSGRVARHPPRGLLAELRLADRGRYWSARGP